MSKRIFWAAFLILGFTLASGLAQQATSEIGGRVLDQSGAAIPGATISIVNEETGTARRQVISTDDGSYLITTLPPGSYELTVEMTGFKKSVTPHLRLRVGKRSDFDVTLQLGEMSEVVTVSDAPPLVETTSKEVGGEVDRRELTELPTVNRNFIGFIGLLPGIVPNISTESFGSDSVTANGQDSRNANFLIDGVGNNDDVIGQRAGGQTRIALETVDEFQVITNQFDAEFGRSSGVIINAITKRGTNQFHGSAFGFFQDSALDAHTFFNNFNGSDKPDTNQRQWGGTVGGPIYKDVAHFFGSLERITIQEGIIVTISGRPDLNGTTTEDTKAWNSLLRGDVQLSDANALAVRWVREASPQFNQIIPRGGIDVTLDAAREEADVDQTYVGTLTSVFNPHLVNEARIGFTRENVTFGNPLFNSGTPMDQAPPTLVHPSFVSQQNDVAQGRINNSYQADEVVSWFVGGSHDVRLGAQYNYVTADNSNDGALNGVFFFGVDDDFNPNDFSTYPNRLQIRVGGPQQFAIVNHNIGLFVQDKWHVTPSLTLSLGLRWDKETIAEDNNNIAPRVGFAYDPRGDGKTVIRGGFGYFYDRTPFEVITAFTTNGPLSSSFTRFFPLNGRDTGPEGGDPPTDPTLANGPFVDRALIDSIVGTGAVLVNPNPFLDNPDRTVPYIRSFSIGVEHQVARNWAFKADYLHSDGEDQWVSVDLNAGMRAEPTEEITRPDPTRGPVTTRATVGSTEYDALQLSLDRRFAADYSLRVAYTLSDSRGNTSGSAFALANFQQGQVLNLDQNQGPSDFDRRHNFVVSGTWEIPKARGLALSGIGRYLSGQPFTLVNSQFDANLNGIAFDPLPAGTYTGVGKNPFPVEFNGRRNGARGPNLFTLDTRLQYKHRFGETTSASFMFEAFNLTNRPNFNTPSGNYARAVPTDSPVASFLDLTGTGIARTLQLGVRFEF